MKLISVPYISQSPGYPTGCESVSAVMLLRYLGYGMSVDDFISRHLRQEDFEEREGALYGPDPRKVFCGSPYREDSFGCYAPVIREALERILGEDYVVKDETGTPMEELLASYIDADMPVVFWACIDMKEPVVGPAWRLKENGEIFTWISNEHCLLLVGYDEEKYYFNDPHNGNGVIGYPKELTEDRHRAQYSMAVGIKRK